MAAIGERFAGRCPLCAHMAPVVPNFRSWDAARPAVGCAGTSFATVKKCSMPAAADSDDFGRQFRSRAQSPTLRRACASLRSRQPVSLDHLHGAIGKSWHRAVRWQRLRQLRQCARRMHQWPLQSRDDLAQRAVAIDGGRGIRHPRMGGLVQQSPAPGADRLHPAGGGRSQLLCSPRGTGYGRVTQTRSPPRFPVRFTSATRADRGEIVIVDDDQSVRSALELRFELEALPVSAFASAEAAFETTPKAACARFEVAGRERA